MPQTKLQCIGPPLYSTAFLHNTTIHFVERKGKRSEHSISRSLVNILLLLTDLYPKTRSYLQFMRKYTTMNTVCIVYYLFLWYSCYCCCFYTATDITVAGHLIRINVSSVQCAHMRLSSRMTVA